MVVGIGFLGLATAAIASHFVNSDAADKHQETTDRQGEILAGPEGDPRPAEEPQRPLRLDRRRLTSPPTPQWYTRHMLKGPLEPTVEPWRPEAARRHEVERERMTRTERRADDESFEDKQADLATEAHLGGAPTPSGSCPTTTRVTTKGLGARGRVGSHGCDDLWISTYRRPVTAERPPRSRSPLMGSSSRSDRLPSCERHAGGAIMIVYDTDASTEPSRREVLSGIPADLPFADARPADTNPSCDTRNNRVSGAVAVFAVLAVRDLGAARAIGWAVAGYSSGRCVSTGPPHRFPLRARRGTRRALPLDDPRRSPRPPQRSPTSRPATRLSRSRSGSCSSACLSSSLGIPERWAVARRLLLGYLVYDTVHFALHHTRPRGPGRPPTPGATHAPPLRRPRTRIRRQRALVGHRLQHAPPPRTTEVVSARSG